MSPATADFPPIACPECGAAMVLKRAGAARAWAKRHPYFWGCSAYPACRSTHGAHPDGRPLGIPADRETKAARIAVHAAFDPLWRAGGPLRRGEAYEWLRLRLGLTHDECHVGRFDLLTCRRALAVLEAEAPGILRAGRLPESYNAAPTEEKRP